MKNRVHRRKVVRRPVSPVIEALVRRQGTCEACGWRVPAVLGGRRLLQVHHVIPVAAEGRSIEPNLALLCPTCHCMAHAIELMRRGRSAGWIRIGPDTRESLFARLRQLTADPEAAAVAITADRQLLDEILARVAKSARREAKLARQSARAARETAV